MDSATETDSRDSKHLFYPYWCASVLVSVAVVVEPVTLLVMLVAVALVLSKVVAVAVVIIDIGLQTLAGPISKASVRVL
jgi:hypothetical protein